MCNRCSERGPRPRRTTREFDAHAGMSESANEAMRNADRIRAEYAQRARDRQRRSYEVVSGCLTVFVWLFAALCVSFAVYACTGTANASVHTAVERAA